MDGEAGWIARQWLPVDCIKSTRFAPRAYDIPNLATLKREVFGAALRVIRWPASDLDPIINPINATGYGLTLGIHSRIDETVQKISKRVRVGNCCVNRNQIGAVVGVQPFGDEGLSGTVSKADGPHDPLRFTTELTLTINTTAAGGKATLLTLDD
jgi:RHH-type proline utilization regulon transcriptional repressor/proline dehydrogenase/delta 1-pyrroline-5-carboxylate dehydrogenase